MIAKATTDVYDKIEIFANTSILFLVVSNSARYF